nr:hypothetical protein [Tanacetum cinerariifolium]
MSGYVGLDTFYNGLTLKHRDTINAAAGGTFMKRRPKECYDLIVNMTAPHNDWDTSAQRTYQAPAYQAPVYQAPVHQLQIPQQQVVTTNEFTNFMKANDAILKNMQTNMTSLTNLNLELKNMFDQFMKINTASSLGSGTHPGNNITNSKEDLKGITSRSGTAYQGPMIPTTSTSSFPVTESPILNSKPVITPIIEPVASPFGLSIKSLLTKKDKLCELARTPLNEHCSVVLLKKLPEKLGDPDKFLIPCDFPRMAECLALADHGIIINLMPLSMWNKLSLPDLSPTCMTLELADRLIFPPVGVAEDVFVKVEYSQEVLNFSDVIASGNPTPYYDPIVSTTSSTLTPFRNSAFLLEEVNAFPALEDDPTSPEVDQSYVDTEGDILLLEAFLNDDPSLPPTDQGNYLPEVRKELKICEAKSDKSSIDEPPEVELKDLPPHLEYVFLEGNDKFPVIIAKDLSIKEKTVLITVLKSHKRDITWKLSDIKVIDPEFCTHKILMEEDFEPAVKHQRRLNPKIYDVIKQENELILTRLVTGWRVCIDYRKLNKATRKDHFPLPFMDQMLKRLAGNQYYCFIDGFSGYFQIPIDPKDQDKTTFTCPYGTFAYHRMPFGLYNAPGTFQRCMIAIFHDMIEKTMKIFGKGKIKIGKLDFDDVYFVKELKFNLFSISQIVPRKNNMYNVNLRNIVPSGDLTCLFAKATLDESNLWHRRLGHINFKTMNDLVKGNLVRGLPSNVFENDN